GLLGRIGRSRRQAEHDQDGTGAGGETAMSGAIKLTLAKRTPPTKTQTIEGSAVEMERRIIMIRWLSIALATLTVPFLHLKPAQAFPLVGLIAVGAVYNTVLQFVLLPRKPAW